MQIGNILITGLESQFLKENKAILEQMIKCDVLIRTEKEHNIELKILKFVELSKKVNLNQIDIDLKKQKLAVKDSLESKIKAFKKQFLANAKIAA